MSQSPLSDPHDRRDENSFGDAAEFQYTTSGGIRVRRREEAIDGALAIAALVDSLDRRRGALLASGCEIPGRYSRWDVGFVDPLLVVTARERSVEVDAPGPRGRALLPFLGEALRRDPTVSRCAVHADRVTLVVRPTSGEFTEEERSRQPSAFSPVRTLVRLFSSRADRHLGLYGAFGYDLAFQFEPIPLHHRRDEEARDLVLYLPDDLIVVDHRTGTATRSRYDFTTPAPRAGSTEGLRALGEQHPFSTSASGAPAGDHAPGEYAETVRRAHERFACGDLFEVVPSQVLVEPSAPAPSKIFSRLRVRNPAPYGFLLNLGGGEHLIGASPEMYVRVGHVERHDGSPGLRVETCPIAGTIERGRDAFEDERQIRKLLNSLKDESELTMCTDVDRNDKARVCEPGSVRVLARRQIEMYSKLIHTVDHVEGTLRKEFDALDAFLTHTWAVTVTGAPKRAAMAFIEAHERSPRRFYGGAVGVIGFDGSLNTGLTLRTVHRRAGFAEVRVGATLLHDSDPEAEEQETHLKASALLEALHADPEADPEALTGTGSPSSLSARACLTPDSPGAGQRLLLLDCQDSFIHTLGDYLRQTGASVTTLRVDAFAKDPEAQLERLRPTRVVLSPGPGKPADFGLDTVLARLLTSGLPVFGVCLGLQAICEYLGATLATLDTPVHGKPSTVRCVDSNRTTGLFRGFPDRFEAGRYHSLFVLRESLPAEVRVTAETEDGIVMAVEHTTLPLQAVQFHPESVLTFERGLGQRLIANVVGGAV